MKLPGLVGFRLCKLDNEELARCVAEGLNKMYDTGKLPDRHIPARPDQDFDLLLGELIVRFNELTDAYKYDEVIEALQALHDVQNGPPLIKYEKDWNEAMELAQKVLAKQ